MNLGKLTKRLKRELGANPKQAAALAAVCLVAIWFWWPLLSKGLSPKKSEAAPTTVMETAPAGSQSVSQEKMQHSWLQRQAWRKEDPLTRSAALPPGARDPFLSLVAAVVEEEKNSEDQVIAKSEPVVDTNSTFDPSKLGLVLEGIAYGKTRRYAQISGRTVREHERVTFGVGGETATKIVAHVTSIGPDEVELHIEGSTLRLQLQPKLLGENEAVTRVKLAHQ